jgi:DNA-binding Lrp family transcriptional regulator
MEYNDHNLIKLYGEKQSYAEIARALNVTSSRVTGRINRMIKAGILSRDPDRHTGKHPRGLLFGKAVKAAVKKIRSKKYTFRTRPHNYVEPTKAELRAQLTQAVENSK